MIFKLVLSSAISLFLLLGTSLAQNEDANCQGLPDAATLRAKLIAAPNIPASDPSGIGGEVGGLFGGTRMWAAVVNRAGHLCGFVTSTADPSQVWPGSQAIAKAKAYTANAFSLDSFALSTARLYTFTQPGHSLWSLGQSNPFNPVFLSAGDTSCADHEIAKRVRHLLGMNPSGGPKIDDIQYSASDGPSVFTHPQCLNVKRNGVTIGTGTEANASGY